MNEWDESEDERTDTNDKWWGVHSPPHVDIFDIMRSACVEGNTQYLRDFAISLRKAVD
jgi:hypothetical protein